MSQTDLVAAYQRLLCSLDPDVGDQAARDWRACEDAVVNIHPDASRAPATRTAPSGSPPHVASLTHHFSNTGFLSEHAIVGHLDQFAGMPLVLVRGRLDVRTPPDTAWNITRNRREAELIVIEAAWPVTTEPRRRFQISRDPSAGGIPGAAH